MRPIVICFSHQRLHDEVGSLSMITKHVLASKDWKGPKGENNHAQCFVMLELELEFHLNGDKL